MTKEQIITEDQLDLMHIIEKDGTASQRLISQNSGFSIGKVNYCLKALIDIGFTIEQIALISFIYIALSAALLFFVKNKLNPEYL